MKKEYEQKQSVEVQLIDSVARSHLGSMLGDASEVVVDSMIEDDTLSAIPIFGTAVKLVRAGLSIRDRLFLRKVYSFLHELSDVPDQAREEFVKQLSEDEGTRSKAGAALLLLLERLDDLDKPKLIGKIYLARLQGMISFEEMRRFSMIVERSFLPDLAKLGNGRVDTIAAPHLESLGLVSITGEDYGTIDGVGAETWHELSEFGKRFLEITFGRTN